MRSELEQLVGAESAQRIVRGPSASFTWQLDAATFVDATLELFRTEDDIPLRRLLVGAAGEAERLLSAGRIDDLETLLGRLSCIAAVALTYRRYEWFEEALKSLVQVYDLGFDARGLRRASIDPDSLWLLVIEHVLALGGLAVRLESWSAVRRLALTKGTGRDFDFYPTWLRHALTMASRAHKFIAQGEDGRRIEQSLISLAGTRITALPCLRTDVAEEDERILNSLCQFDALAAIVAIDEMGKPESKGFYVNFARFYSERTQPALVRLITDSDMRSTLFRGSDRALAIAIAALDEQARNEGFRFAGWWGLDDPILREFLEANLPEATA